MTKKIIYHVYIFCILFSALPDLAFSQNFVLGTSNIRDVLFYLVRLLSLLNPILFILAFIVFFWGLSKSILNSGNKDEIQKGKEYMLWGILALFVLASFRVLISFISNSFGFGPASITPLIRLAP